MSQSHISTSETPTPEEFASLVSAIGLSASEAMEEEHAAEYMVRYLARCLDDVVRLSELLVRSDDALAHEFWELYGNFVIWGKCPPNEHSQQP